MASSSSSGDSHVRPLLPESTATVPSSTANPQAKQTQPIQPTNSHFDTTADSDTSCNSDTSSHYDTTSELTVDQVSPVSTSSVEENEDQSSSFCSSASPPKPVTTAAAPTTFLAEEGENEDFSPCLGIRAQAEEKEKEKEKEQLLLESSWVETVRTVSYNAFLVFLCLTAAVEFGLDLWPFKSRQFSPGFRLYQLEEIPLDEPTLGYALEYPQEDDEKRAKTVKEATESAWRAYVSFAWGNDTLLPLARMGENDYSGVAVTMVDSLDLLYMMGLEQEFHTACDWIVENLSFDIQEGVNVFETTIRVLGGLLSAYAQSNREDLKEMAVRLGDKLLPAFDTHLGVPYGTLGFRTGKKSNPAWAKGFSSLAEIGTLSLEFRYLSFISGDDKYREKVDRVSRWLQSKMNAGGSVKDGLFPMFVHPQTGEFGRTVITVGGRVDSLYEYFLKGWLQTNRTEDWLKHMYDVSLKGIVTRLVKRTKGRKRHVYIAELDHHLNEISKMDHLVCFIPGMIALGIHRGASKNPRAVEKLLLLAKHLMKTCFYMYESMPTGLAPEIAEFPRGRRTRELIARRDAKHSIIRPETVESLFILHRVTNDPVYKSWGWRIFSSIEKYARVPSGGYAGVDDVTSNKPGRVDKMESFVISETLKYLYLLFSPRELYPLDEYVFNTEGHMLPVFKWEHQDAQCQETE